MQLTATFTFAEARSSRIRRVEALHSANLTYYNIKLCAESIKTVRQRHVVRELVFFKTPESGIQFYLDVIGSFKAFNKSLGEALLKTS